MLIDNSVKIKWYTKTKKHYEGLGYKYTKIGDEFEVKVEDLPKNSLVKIKCYCDNCRKNLLWTYCDYNRQVKENGETYCKCCANKLYARENARKTKLKNGKSFYDWCMNNNRQDVLNRWDYELNGCSPKDVCCGSKNKFWFKCDKHEEHHSELKNIKGFTGGSEGSISCKQCNSIAQYILDNFPNKKLEEVWDFKKNSGLDPWEINRCSSQKIFIKCQKNNYHESYEVKCCGFYNGNRCSYCNGKKVHPKDSLGQYIIDNYSEEFLWSIWSNKNEKSPFEYKIRSNEKVWFKCVDKKHIDTLRIIGNAIKCEFRCPKCVEENNVSIIESKTKTYLNKLGYEVKTEYECTIIPINPKTKHPMPFDNEIILENGKHLIIEVHGSQHYEIRYYKNINKCTNKEAEEMLYQRQLYDRYKRMYAKYMGYEYLEIPYNDFEGKNKYQYKQIIDNKIGECLLWCKDM